MKKLLSFLTAFILIISLSFPVSVQAAVKLNKAKATMEVDSTLKLKLDSIDSSKVSWKSSNIKIATVSKTGTITAKSEGSATITATYKSTKYACSLAVVDSNKKSSSNSSVDGSRKYPFNGYDGVALTFTGYDGSQQDISITLAKLIEGEEANSIVMSENQFNTEPSSDQKWVLMAFAFKYISSTTDQEISVSDYINSSSFYTKSGSTKIKVYDTASFANVLTDSGVYDVVLYPEGESDVWFAMLVDDSVDDISLKFGHDSTGTVWMKIK